MLDQKMPSARPAHHVADEAVNLPDLFRKRVRATPTRDAYLEKVGRQWRASSWQQFHDRAAAVASALIGWGLKPGDKICIVGGTRPQWAIGDFAGQLAACVTIGAYPTLSASQLAYILNHSDSRVVFVEGREEIEKLLSISDEIPKVERIVVWNYQELDSVQGRDKRIVAFDSLLATPLNSDEIERRVEAIEPEETAIIIYTSGTTGPPKGAMISHANIIAFLRMGKQLVEFEEDDNTLSFLPMAHAAERIAGFYSRISAGMVAAYATSIATVLDEVKEIKPTIFGSVPRIFEKAYAKIMSEVEKAPAGKRRIFRWAEGIGRNVVRHWQRGESIPTGLRMQYALVDRLVFSKIREAFGGRVRHFVTGAAPISPDILEFFWAAGFPIYEVYGMTEATVITHVNKAGSVRLGSVGKPLPGIETRLADDGEILMRGPTIFKGYYKNPEATADTIDKDGWLHTGDIGRMDDDGFLRIVDRKKHIIITAGGKNITPANIEQDIKARSSFISLVHVHGDRRPYLTALVTIHPVEALDWARDKGIGGDRTTLDRIIGELQANPLARPEGLGAVMQVVTTHPEVRRRIASAIAEANTQFSRVEQVKKFHILERDFSVDEDEITPTLKVKRKNVENKYAGLFDRLYAEKGFGTDVPEPAQAKRAASAA